jgi:hypothetical protein
LKRISKIPPKDAGDTFFCSCSFSCAWIRPPQLSRA